MKITFPTRVLRGSPVKHFKDPQTNSVASQPQKVLCVNSSELEALTVLVKTSGVRENTSLKIWYKTKPKKKKESLNQPQPIVSQNTALVG